MFGCSGAGKFFSHIDLITTTATYYDYTAVVEEGLSYNLFTRLYGCKPIIVQPNGHLTFNYFDIIYVLTRGGPLNATVIFPTRIYEVGFGQFRFGEAAAYGSISVVVLILIVTFLMLFRLLGRAEVAR